MKAQTLALYKLARMLSEPYITNEQAEIVHKYATLVDDCEIKRGIIYRFKCNYLPFKLEYVPIYGMDLRDFIVCSNDVKMREAILGDKERLMQHISDEYGSTSKGA